MIIRPAIYLAVYCSFLLAFSLFSCAPAGPEDEEVIVEEEIAEEEVTQEEVLPKPAEFTVESLAISDDEIERYQSCTISVDVTNIGDVKGDYEVTLYVDDEVVETKQVTLDVGATRTVSFSFSSSQSGIYKIDVNGLSGTVKVKAASAPSIPSPPAPSPDTTTGTWKQMTSGTTKTLYSVYGVSSSEVFAVGEEGIMLYYDGSTWNPMLDKEFFQDERGTFYFDRALFTIWCSSSSDIFVGGIVSHPEQTTTDVYNVILQYDGSSWSVEEISSMKSFQGIWGTSSSDVFAVGGGLDVWHYDGSYWDLMYTTKSDIEETYYMKKIFSALWGSSSSDVFAVGLDGILHFDGIIWDKMRSRVLHNVWGSSSSDVFAVGPRGTILHYDGNDWNSMSSNTTENLYGVWGSSSSDIFAVGSEGTILHYDGNIWNSMTSNTTKTLYSIWGSSYSDVFAVGSDGTILRYEK